MVSPHQKGETLKKCKKTGSFRRVSGDVRASLLPFFGESHRKALASTSKDRKIILPKRGLF
ncbi:MAG: hypothetical protein DWI25_06410 [Planctomycetota bacterium]|nr:MAG: hypothetical protein DWI25_06410 [Planctomycetota bacterium]